MNKNYFLLKFLIIPSLINQKFRLLKMIVALIILSLMQSLFLFVVGPLFKTLFLIKPDVEKLFLKDILSSHLVDYFSTLQDVYIYRSNIIIFLPLIIIIIALIRSVASYYYHLNQFFFSLFVAKNYRDILFDAIISQPYSLLMKKTPAEWTSIITHDVYFLQNKFSDILTSFIKDPILILSCFLALIFLHWQSALLLLFIGALLAIIMSNIANKISYYANFWQQALAKVVARFLNIRLRFNFIRAQNGEEAENLRFQKVNNHFYRIIRRSIFVRSSFASMLEFIGFVIFALFVWLLSGGYFKNLYNPYKMLELFVALGLILKPLREFGEQVARFKETQGSLQRSLDIIEKFLLNTKNPNNSTLSVMIGSDEISNKQLINDELYFYELWCGYDDKVVFKASNLNLKLSYAYAVIGPSGAGKSTFIKTLSGLLPPMKWEEKFLTSWEVVADNSCFVSQDPFLFEDTLKNNLLYGVNDPKQFSDEKIFEYLKLLNIYDEVKNLKYGLNTIIKSIDFNLSGGQLQRLVVIRELIRDKKILLFDEISSAIDFKTEKDIIEKIVHFAKLNNKLLIFVTHRLQCLEMFDEIIFVENGNLMFKGTHKHLLQNQRYQSFYEMGQLHIQNYS